jgi:hypothetical protein
VRIALRHHACFSSFRHLFRFTVIVIVVLFVVVSSLYSSSPSLFVTFIIIASSCFVLLSRRVFHSLPYFNLLFCLSVMDSFFFPCRSVCLSAKRLFQRHYSFVYCSSVGLSSRLARRSLLSSRPRSRGECTERRIIVGCRCNLCVACYPQFGVQILNFRIPLNSISISASLRLLSSQGKSGPGVLFNVTQ